MSMSWRLQCQRKTVAILQHTLSSIKYFIVIIKLIDSPHPCTYNKIILFWLLYHTKLLNFYPAQYWRKKTFTDYIVSRKALIILGNNQCLFLLYTNLMKGGNESCLPIYWKADKNFATKQQWNFDSIQRKENYYGKHIRKV